MSCHGLGLGFIGGGNMAYAIVKGLINIGKYDPSSMIVSAPSNRNLPKFKDLGCHITNNNSEVVEILNNYDSKIIFLCVKPQVYLALKYCFKDLLINFSGTLISIMAGVNLKQLSLIANDKCTVYRTIPNTAVEIGKGVWPISSHEKVSETILSLLGSISKCEQVKEEELNIIAGLSGSGIAFVYSMIQAMIDGGVKMGLSRSSSTKYSARTFIGAAEMILNSKAHPYALRDLVCSPGGSTIAGLHSLEKSSYYSGIMDAVEIATKTAASLGNE